MDELNVTRMELRLGSSLAYPLVLHFYRGRILVARVNVRWIGVPATLWTLFRGSVAAWWQR
jgi:hypothetical protein